MAYSAGKPVDSSGGLVDTREKSGEWKERSMKRSHISSDRANNERESAKFPKLLCIQQTKNNSAVEADMANSLVDISAEINENMGDKAKSLETFVAGPMDSLEKSADIVGDEVKRPADYVATDYIISSKESYIPSDCVTRASDSLGDEAKYQPDGVYQSVVSSADIADSTADLLMDSPTEDIPRASAHSLMDTATTTGEEKDLNLFVPVISSVECSATIEGK
jgi:hypothetical protein